MNKYLIKLANHLDGKGFHKEADYVDFILRKKAEEADRENFRFFKNSADFINYNNVDYDLVKKYYFEIIDYVIYSAEDFLGTDVAARKTDGVGQFFRRFAMSWLDGSNSDREFFKRNYPGLESSWDSAALFRTLVAHSMKLFDFCGKLPEGGYSIPKRVECLKDALSFVSDSDNLKAEDFKDFVKNYKHRVKSSRLEDRYSGGNLSEYEFEKEKLGYGYDAGKINFSEYSESLKDLRKKHDIPEPVLDDESSEEEF